MTFPTLVGGVVVFGLLWLVVPRASFMVALSLLLKNSYGVMLFPSDEAIHAGVATWWNVSATIMIVLLGVVMGLVLDFLEHRHTLRGS